jgi:hypothetical protein
VKPSSAIDFRQLRKDRWAHALLLGGPLRRQEIRDPKITEWVRLNSKALRRQLGSVDPVDRDGFGLVLVLATFTSPTFTDIQFLNQRDALAPVVMGWTPGPVGSSKWLRGYPLDTSQSSFDGEIHVNERAGVFLFWTWLTIDGGGLDYVCEWIFHSKGVRRQKAHRSCK